MNHELCIKEINISFILNSLFLILDSYSLRYPLHIFQIHHSNSSAFSFELWVLNLFPVCHVKEQMRCICDASTEASWMEHDWISRVQYQERRRKSASQIMGFLFFMKFRPINASVYWQNFISGLTPEINLYPQTYPQSQNSNCWHFFFMFK